MRHAGREGVLLQGDEPPWIHIRLLSSSHNRGFNRTVHATVQGCWCSLSTACEHIMCEGINTFISCSGHSFYFSKDSLSTVCSPQKDPTHKHKQPVTEQPQWVVCVWWGRRGCLIFIQDSIHFKPRWTADQDSTPSVGQVYFLKQEQEEKSSWVFTQNFTGMLLFVYICAKINYRCSRLKSF